MYEAKNASLQDRLKAQQEAKKAMLAKFKPKPANPDPLFEQRKAMREAELAQVRQARADAKEAARLRALEEEEARKQALLQDEDAILAAARAERKERKAQAKAEARAKREASAAMRKGR